MSIVDILNEIRQTDVTKTVHRTPYNAISVTRPELTQAGRTILITGGGTGAGFAMAQAFIHASAGTVIIVGRRVEVLETARVKLEAEAKTAGSNTKIITRKCDMAKDTDVDALWQYFADQGIVVDVYVANAAAFSESVGMMQLGADKVWAMFETNVEGPMYFTEKFLIQPGAGEKQKVSNIIVRMRSAVLTDLVHRQRHDCKHTCYTPSCGSWIAVVYAVEVCGNVVLPVPGSGDGS